MEKSIEIKKINKEINQNFIFYLNLLGEKDTDLFNNELKLPKMPLLGYSKSENNKYSHSLGNLLSIVSFQIDICQGENNNEIISKYSDFSLPSNIEEYLNIEEFIEIDNNTEDKNTNFFFMPKKKLNFYFIISENPKYLDDNQNEINEDEIEDYINENNANQINVINEHNEKNDFLLFNIIPHFYYFKDNKEKIFDINNLNYQRQITLFNVNIKNYNDVRNENDNSFIEINNLREETSNLQIIDNQIIFLPDNLKFILNISKELSHFYLLITLTEQDYHSVFYFITCNNIEAKKKMKIILSKSTTLNEIIENIIKNFKKSKDITSHLKDIFNYQK